MNAFVYDRLNGLLHSMYGQYLSNKASASAAKGAGRAEFIRNFLSRVNGQAFRIQESAEITDIYGRKTGEIDIVLENGLCPSLPLIDSESARLHFAEGVGAGIEVKSNLSGQWKEAVSSARKVREIRRNYLGGTFASPGRPHIVQVPTIFTANNLPIAEVEEYPYRDKIPFFLVGYSGWANLDTLKAKFGEQADLFAGVLQIEPAMYVGSPSLSSEAITGPLSLLCFLSDLHLSFSHIKEASFDLLDYGRNI